MEINPNASKKRMIEAILEKGTSEEEIVQLLDDSYHHVNTSKTRKRPEKRLVTFEARLIRIEQDIDEIKGLLKDMLKKT